MRDQTMKAGLSIGCMAIGFVISLLLFGCGGGGGGGVAAPDTTPPSVSSTNPANGATGLAVNGAITVTFSEAMDPTTLNTSTFTLKDGNNNPVSGTVAYSGTTATFKPDASLSPAATYTATISTEVKDLGGNHMASPYSWSFTTGAMSDTTPPVVISTNPANGTTGIAVNSVITVTFSEAMNDLTINTFTFTLKDSSNNPVSGTITYTGTTATFAPSVTLAYSTTYTAMITTGVKDLAGNPMFANYSWSFTTGALPSGSLDTSFGNSGVVITSISSGNDWANALGIQSDEKIIVAGISFSGSGSIVVRYNPDGSLDTGFGNSGMVSSAVIGTMALGIQPDGKVVVAGGSPMGNNYDFAVARYNPDGSLDAGFGSGGVVITPISDIYDDIARTLGIQSDGKIVVAGYISDSQLSYNFQSSNYDFAVARYNPDGSLDTGFGSDGKVITDLDSNRHDDAYALSIQSDGKIVVTGWSINNPGTSSPNYDFAVARYNPDGSLDTGFGSGGKVITDLGSYNDTAYALSIQSDGKIVVAGSSNQYDFALARYNPDGSLDTGFGNDGKIITSVSSNNDWARALGIQSDGKIVAAGTSLNGSNFDFALVRYNPDGSLDTSFGSGGVVITDLSAIDEAYALGIQSDGKIVVAGRTINLGYDIALVRYWP